MRRKVYFVVVATKPLPRDKVWRKTMGLQKPGNSPGPETEVVERQRITKEGAAQRVRSWTVQNEMRGVLGRMSADGMKDSRFCQSQKDKSLTAGCVRWSEDETTHSEHKFLGGNRGKLCVEKPR